MTLYTPYPDSSQIGFLTESLLKGGGRHTYTYATQGPYETVVAWYDTHFGSQRVPEANQATWQAVGDRGVSLEVTVTAMTPDWMPFLSSLEEFVWPLQQTIIRMQHTCLSPRWRWFGWLRRSDASL